MEYFEWFDIVPALSIDEKQLQKAYYSKSKSFHPDYHTDKSTEEQNKMMAMSIMNTKAYTLLSTFEGRLNYVLTQKGFVSPGSDYKLPPDFLMEMMEVNETAESALQENNENIKSECIAQLNALEKDLTASINPIILKNKLDTFNDADWDLLTMYYYKNKYIQRLKLLLEKGNGDAALDF